jgi:hypothetical protein
VEQLVACNGECVALELGFWIVGGGGERGGAMVERGVVITDGGDSAPELGFQGC